ncbi:MAG: hypothetical protein LUQ31_03190 [Methanoregula sp.]|nr:hypothetical protein [Methanoregula sp.]
MKSYTAIAGFVMIFLMIASVSAATSGSSGSSSGTSTVTASSTSSASTTLSGEQALSQVYVSSVTLDPEEYYPYEEGTITVQVTNSGTQSVAFSDADIISSNILVENEAANPYRSMIYLGPGVTMTYTFVVVAKPPEGTYFPMFTLASRDSGSLRYPITIKIASKPIEETFSLRPDNFALNSTDTVNLTITNPREGAISNIVITPSGSGFGISPRQVNIESLAAGSSVDVPFAITPYEASSVNFSIRYNNGQMNPHSDTLILPLNLGTSKTAAHPIINNLALTSTDGEYQLTGDVTNTGITDATGLVMSVESPAKPVEPYSSYAVGSLVSNDFASFTLTFTSADLSAVPVRLQWKDANGNTLSTIQTLDLRSLGATLSASRSGSSESSVIGGTGSTAAGSAGSGSRGGGMFGIGGGRAGGLASFIPLIAGSVIVIAAIALYVKRKWILAKIRKQ